MNGESPPPPSSQQKDFLRHLDEMHRNAMRASRATVRGRGRSYARTLMDIQGIEAMQQRVRNWRTR